MLPRPLTLDDLPALFEIDGTVHSQSYLHVNRSEEENATIWRIETRPRRDKAVDANRIDDDLVFTVKQIVGGNDTGTALCIEMDEIPVAALIAQPREAQRLMHLIDVRVDFDFRRQGLGTALAYALIGQARDAEMRAVTAETRTDNFPAISFLKKLGFEPAGLDTHRLSNHDLVKERATLLWCLAFD